MMLIGMFDSPFVRPVAIALKRLNIGEGISVALNGTNREDCQSQYDSRPHESSATVRLAGAIPFVLSI